MSINPMCSACVQDQAACDYHRGYQDGAQATLHAVTAALTPTAPAKER